MGEFDFDDNDDEFAFDSDDDFDFEDDFETEDEFAFEAEDDDFALGEDDDDFGLGGDDDFDFGNNVDDFDFDDDQVAAATVPTTAGGGSNRTFLLVAGMMMVMFVIALILVAFLVINRGPSDFEVAQNARETENAIVVAFASQTEEASIASQTAAAQLTSSAPTVTPVRPTVTPTPTLTLVPTIDPTTAAEQTIIAATQQAIIQLSKVPPTSTGAPGLQAGDVEATGTALAIILSGAGGGEATPTPEGFVPTPGGAPLPQATVVTALPDTGIFDNIGEGGAVSITTIILAAFGLLAVIFASRRMRASIEKQ